MKRSAAVAAIAMALAVPATADAATIGATTVYAPVTNNAPGVAQVYGFTGPASGQVDGINVYVDRASTARQVELGLYGGAESGAGARRAGCVITNPQAGAWNRCSIAPSAVSSGAMYWLALLQPAGTSGTLQYREAKIGGGPATWLSKSKK